MRIMEKNKNDKIKKSKEIIKKEKEKIKEEKKKLKEEKRQKFYNTKLGKILKKIFFLNSSSQLNTESIIYHEILGAILCLLVLFFLSGGKNYIKLYKDLQKLINVYDTISSDYYQEIDKNKLIDNAIESMLSATGDSYTTYTNKQNTKDFLETVSGTYEGIGCMVTMDESGNISVLNIFDNSPAQKAGLQEKDIILKIDGQDYQGKTSEDMSNYVKNSQNSKIELTIKRDRRKKYYN